jgi:hypothetical protein
MSKEHRLDLELYPAGQVLFQDTVSKTIGPENLASWNSDRMGKITELSKINS